MNVVSNFARDNDAFSTPEEAIGYSRSRQARRRLVIPDADILIVDRFHFDEGFGALKIGFTNGRVIVFRIVAGDLVAEYGMLHESSGTDNGTTSQHKDEISLTFTKTGNIFKWFPGKVLEPLVGQELAGFDELRNQYFIRFSIDMIYICTLSNFDTGSTVLFWTQSE